VVNAIFSIPSAGKNAGLKRSKLAVEKYHAKMLECNKNIGTEGNERLY
jgi:hypothetical protein